MQAKKTLPWHSPSDDAVIYVVTEVGTKVNQEIEIQKASCSPPASQSTVPIT